MALAFRNRGLNSFPAIGRSLHLTRLDLSDNPLQDFRGMAPYASLRHLIASNTKIQSFAGAVPQADLEELTLLNTPLGCERYFWVMALIVFGEGLTIVNGQQLGAAQLREAYAIAPSIGLFLRDGWVLKRLKPVTLLNPVTRGRRVLYAAAGPWLRSASALASPPRTALSRKGRRSPTRSKRAPKVEEAAAPEVAELETAAVDEGEPALPAIAASEAVVEEEEELESLQS
jgi:hypothetical protein